MAESKIILSKDLMDKVIEELTEYRAIGTVEGYELAIQSSIENYNLYREYKAKVQQYEAIGTVEEFQSMKEKNDTLRALYEDARKEGNHLIAKERAKVIDEFAEAIRAIHYKYPIGTDADTNEPLYGHEDGTWHNLIDDVSEQMKEV